MKMFRLYKTLENIVKKCVAESLVIGGLVGVLGFGNLAYENKLYGDDILVNTYTEGVQLRPDIAINDNGDTVVTWESYYKDYSLYDVFAQRFDSKMNKLGQEFQVNPSTEGRCGEKYVVMDKEGKFIISWRNSSNWRAYAQRFDSKGNKIGNEFRVDPTESEQRYPHIVMDGEGNFLVAFRYGQYGPAYAQRFDKDGNRRGDEFKIDGYQSRIAMDYNGDFITTDTDGARETLYAYRYNNYGERIGEALQVSLSKAGGADSEIGQSSVALNDTDFVVTWKDYGGSYGVYARRFNRDGNSLGEEFLVNRGKIMCYSSFPDVAMDKEGKFIIIWTLSPQGNPEDVYAQRFDENGNRIGDEFRVNDSNHPVDWEGARVAMNQYNGDFVVSWGNGDIYAKKFSFYNPADLNKDGYVDFKDFGIFTNNWLAYYP